MDENTVVPKKRRFVFNTRAFRFAVFVIILGFIYILYRTPTPVNRQVTVTGYSSNQQKNETASFTAGVLVTDKDKSVAVEKANKQAEDIIAALKKFGVEEKDLKTQNISIYQNQESYYEDGVQKYRYGDWNASLNVEVILRDVSRVSELSNLLASLETSSIWGPNFTLNTDSTDESALLSSAYDDAKQKAEKLATSMGLKLGKVVTISENTSNTSPVMYEARGAGGGGGGFEPGSSVVSGSVNVTFELY